MAYITWKELTTKLNKMIPEGYVVKSKLKLIIDPQDESVTIEAKSYEKQKRT